MRKIPPEPLAILFFETQTDWAAWLEENHAGSKGIWIKMAKKSAGVSSVNLRQAQESAMCFGWVDSQAAPLDDFFWLIKFTPRGPRSRWSPRNRDKAEALITEGKMQPAGLYQVERARADGRWQ